MSTELFNMDIFNQILNANMLSYYDVAEEFSIKVKDSLSKFSMFSKKIVLIEDRQAIENPNVFKIFTTEKPENMKVKLKDTRVFTEPRLNYCAQMQLSEQYNILFYLKGGFSNYTNYDDLIDDQLIDVSDSDDSDDEMSNEFIVKVPRDRKFTFSKRPSELKNR